MPRIEIIERDETSAGVFASDTDVVYIPGLVDYSQSCLYSEGKYAGIKAGVPTLFTSLNSFENLCGKRGFVFKENMYYDDIVIAEEDGNRFAFSDNAMPQHKIMLPKGSIDPSYIMAKELLAAGLSVVYERLNDDSDTFEKVNITSDKLEEAKESYKKYFKKLQTFIPTRPSDPLWYSKITDSTSVALEEIKDEETTVAYITTDAMKFSVDLEVLYKNESSEVIIIDASNANKEKELTTNIIPKDTLVKIKINDSKVVLDDVTLKIHNSTLKTFINGTNNNKLVDTFSLSSIANVYTYDDSIHYYSSDSGETDITVRSIAAGENPPELSIVVLQDTSILENSYKVYGDSYVKFSSKDDFDGDNCYELSMSISLSSIYSKLSDALSLGGDNNLCDKGSISIKYLTSGGYPVFEYDKNSLALKMIKLAKDRGDCVAIIDHTNNPYREINIDREGSVYKTLTDKENPDCTALWSEFATMFTPWAEFSRTTTDKDDNSNVIENSEDNPIFGLTSIELPGSFAYLITLADSIKTNANWLAVAGSARGVVQNIAQGGMKVEITNGAADGMQPRDGVSINAITNIKPYGYTIWGNRTLKNNGEKGNLTATSFLNVRNLVSDVKKQAYTVSRQLTFEQNNDVLWANFKSLISGLLDRMLTGYGISGYKIERDLEHEKASEKATVCARIILYPVYAVEDFYITVVLRDDEVSVE